MDNFWTWLKKANAKTVFFCLLIALAGVTAWWVWNLITPIRVEAHVATGSPQDQSGPSLGLIAYLQVQRVPETNVVTSLFNPPEELSQRAVKPRDKTEPSNPPSKMKPRKEPDKVAPARVKEVVTLTYRGMYVRGDGIPMALIQDSKSQQPSFYTAGTNLFGLKLKSIGNETLDVNLADESSATLLRGISQSFTEGKHAE